MRAPASVFRHDGPFWRALAAFGAAHAPRPVVRYSPPIWGAAFALAMPGARARVRQNLRRVLGARSYGAELCDVFRTFSHFASCLTEALTLGGRKITPPEAVVLGAEHLRRALTAGRGVIWVTAHTGGWEIAGPLLRREVDRDVVIVMEREPDAGARAIQDRARERSGVKVVHVGGEPLAALPLLAHLRRGGMVGVQIDRSPNPERAFEVPLFGAPAGVPSGPFLLARASGAPIVPVFTRRLGHFRYEIRICAPLAVARDAPDAALVEVAVAAAREMERFLRAHPTHWFDFGRPAG